VLCQIHLDCRGVAHFRLMYEGRTLEGPGIAVPAAGSGPGGAE